VLYTCSQLTVRERARASRAKAYVALLVELAAKHQRFYVPGPLLYAFAALDKQRLIPVPCERERREQTARPRAHDDDPARVQRSILYARLRILLGAAVLCFQP